MNSISGIQPLQSLPPVSPGPQPSSEGTSSFKNFLLDSIHEVNSMQQEADRAVETMFSGGDVSPAEVLTAVQKADLTFRMMMQARNKMMQVYQEIKDIRI